MSSVNFHNLSKSFNVGSPARHMADRFQIPLTPEFDVSLFFLAFIIRDSRWYLAHESINRLMSF